MAKLNVYVPDQLRKRMNAVKEPVNWSSLACDAFERELGRIAKQKKEKKMNDVIQRLKASKLEDESALRSRGRTDGSKWARDRASAADLKRLAVATNQSSLEDLFGEVGESAYSCGERFVMSLVPGDEFDRSSAVDFWEFHAGRDWEALSGEPEYVKGFAAGALDIWAKVENRI